MPNILVYASFETTNPQYKNFQYQFSGFPIIIREENKKRFIGSILFVSMLTQHTTKIEVEPTFGLSKIAIEETGLFGKKIMKLDPVAEAHA